LKVWQIAREWSIDAMEQVERPEPEPGLGQIVVRMRAASLNYRDLLTVLGKGHVQTSAHSVLRRCRRSCCRWRRRDPGFDRRSSVPDVGLTGYQMRATRALIGVSQGEIAAAAGVTRQTIERLERSGPQPVVSHDATVAAVLAALGAASK
jgi:DNA-binding XRE family transcriptional regulator